MSYRTTTVTVANGASLSGAVRLNNPVGAADKGIRETLVAIVMPATWTAAVLTFQASNDNSSFSDMYTTNGSEVTSQASASRWIAFDPADFAGVAYLKVRSGTSAAAVNQGGDRVITLIFRPVP